MCTYLQCRILYASHFVVRFLISRSGAVMSDSHECVEACVESFNHFLNLYILNRIRLHENMKKMFLCDCIFMDHGMV